MLCPWNFFHRFSNDSALPGALFYFPLIPHPVMKTTAVERRAALNRILAERIFILDGGMGTMIQKHRLAEADYRGSRFADTEQYPQDLLNNNDVLSLTRPEILRGIYDAYFAAGSDMVSTCTFSSTALGQHEFFHHEPPCRHDQDYYERVLQDAPLAALVREMNLAVKNVLHM